jgi:hypothetical protein
MPQVEAVCGGELGTGPHTRNVSPAPAGRAAGGDRLTASLAVAPRARSSTGRLLAALIVLAALVAALIVVLTSSSSATPPRSMESLFQDDDHLLYASTATVTSTLDTLKGLGVDRIRATVLWRAIAPDPAATAPPAGVDPTNPSDYPAATWAPYDRLVELARARGIGVDFNIGAPGPLWAMARGAPAAKYADHWVPSPTRFGQFVAAVARRYSGSYSAAAGSTLPRVSYWSIWNEPNQPGWLAPQWQSGGGRTVPESPVLYRSLVDAAFRALERTGHGPSTDTILIGELAPEGSEGPSFNYRTPIPPMPFLRALYCVDSTYRPLTGSAAAALACPQGGQAKTFVSGNPALFDATGFAHHPYSFFLAPNVQMADTNFAPLSDLPRLEHGLDAIFGAYGVSRSLPLYLTEYGYETNPPNPYRGVSPALQSLYINEAEYLAWRDPRVRAMSQFLLYDSPPDPSYPRGSEGYWSTFQTGLLYASGAAKPSLAAYRLPIFVPQPVLGAGRSVFVWGRLRPAPHATAQRAQIQWRSPTGSYRTLATVTTANRSGVLSAEVQVPGPGSIRIAWVSPAGRLLDSRAVGLQGH